MASNTILFTIIGVIVVATMIVGMLISQSRHRDLEMRNNQIRILGLQQRRLQNLIRSLPANFLSVELRDFLYQALLQNIKSQQDLVDDKNNLLKSDFERISEERKAAKAQPPAAKATNFSPDQTSVYRGLLKTVHQFVVRNYETGRLKKDHAENMIKQVELKLVETAVDFFVLTAEELQQQNNYRQARNAFQKALNTIEESPHSQEFKQETVKIQSTIKQLVETWRASREQHSKEAGAKLAGEMENFVDDQDDWKKKTDLRIDFNHLSQECNPLKGSES